MQYTPPPYSCTRERALYGCGNRSVFESLLKLTITVRPDSAGLRSSQKMVPAWIRTASSATESEATSSLVIGDFQLP